MKQVVDRADRFKETICPMVGYENGNRGCDGGGGDGEGEDGFPML